MSLFKFELIKLLRNKKTWALLIITILSLFLVIFQLNNQQKRLAKKQFQQIEAWYNLAHHQRYTDYNEEDGSITPENQRLVDQLTEIKQTIKELDQQRLAHQWQKELSLQIQFDEQVITFLQTGGNFDHLTLSDLAMNKQEHERLQLNHIQPTTIEAGQGGWYFVKYFADYWFYFSGILLLLLFCYDAYTMEKESRSIKFLFVQPFSKTAIFRNKIISNFVIVTSIGLILWAVMFIIGTIQYGPGSLLYPIAYEKNGQAGFITLASYLINGLALHSIFSLFILVYLFILSLWRNNSFEVLGFSLVTLLLPYLIFNEVPILNKNRQFFPFHYLNIKELLVNQQSLILNYIVITLWLILGILILKQFIGRSANEFN